MCICCTRSETCQFSTQAYWWSQSYGLKDTKLWYWFEIRVCGVFLTSSSSSTISAWSQAQATCRAVQRSSSCRLTFSPFSIKISAANTLSWRAHCRQKQKRIHTCSLPSHRGENLMFSTTKKAAQLFVTALKKEITNYFHRSWHGRLE